MSFTSGPINETEQAGEKFADHVGERAQPIAIAIIEALFQRIWRTRIVIDVSERK